MELNRKDLKKSCQNTMYHRRGKPGEQLCILEREFLIKIEKGLVILKKSSKIRRDTGTKEEDLEEQPQKVMRDRFAQSKSFQATQIGRTFFIFLDYKTEWKPLKPDKNKH